MKIICTESEKDRMITALANSPEDCVICPSCESIFGCKECLEKHIDWEVFE